MINNFNCLQSLSKSISVFQMIGQKVHGIQANGKLVL